MFLAPGASPRKTAAATPAQANTPRATVAMITHEVPGDTFWDLIRKGAEAAAAKDNIELRYSNDPEAPNQANLVQSAIDSGRRHRADAGQARRHGAGRRGRDRRDIPVVAFNSGFDDWKAMGVQQYFGQDENLAGIAAGERLHQGRCEEDVCVIQEQGQVALESRCAGVTQGFTGPVRDPERQQQGHAVRRGDHHRQAAVRTRPSTTSSRWAPRSR